MQKLSVAKKVGIAIVAILLILAISVAILFAVVKQRESAFQYSEEQHLQRVTERAIEHYLSEDSQYINPIEDVQYTDLKVYPIYNADETLEFFVIEFEPYGFIYVTIHYTTGMVFHTFRICSMYTVSEGFPWQRYRYWGNADEQYPDSKWQYDGYKQVCEVDDNGEFIEYKDSHFKVANVQDDERRYFIRAKRGHIPAVKRGDRYLNLVSMEEFTLEEAYQNEHISVCGAHFVPKTSKNL